MYYLKLHIIFFVYFLVSILKVSAQNSITSNINKNNILIGEQAIITIRAQVPNDSKVEFPTYDSLKTIIPGIEVLSQHDSIVVSDSQNTHIRKYFITSFNSANYSIPPFNIKINNKIVKTNQIPLKVNTVNVDTIHIEKFYDIKPPMEPAFDINEWITPILLSILSFIVSFVITYIIIRIKDNQPIIRRFKFTPYTPPHKKALNEIKKLHYKEGVAIDDAKGYYTQLTDILRKYMQGRYGFNAMEMTTDEIISELQKVNDESAVKELYKLFLTADLVKFAKLVPDLSENDKNLINAISYIQNTRKEEVVEQSPKEVIVEDIRSKKAKRWLYTSIVIASIILVIVVVYLLQYIYILNY